MASIIIELDIGHDSPIRQFPVPYPSYIFSLMKFVNVLHISIPRQFPDDGFAICLVRYVHLDNSHNFTNNCIQCFAS